MQPKEAEAIKRIAGSGSKMPERLVYSINEVSELLDMAPGSIYKACKNGQIPCLAIGKRIVIPKARFERFLQGDGQGEG